MSTPNFYRLETSRWDLSTITNAFITEPLDNSGGWLETSPSEGEGLGIEMNMAFLRRA